MKEGIIKDAYELVIKEVQTIISISYIAAVGIGMLFNYQKYILFGINIFDYADVFDFLISPFSDVKILSFTVISILLALLIAYLDVLWKKKFPEAYSRFNLGWDKKSWFTTMRIISTANSDCPLLDHSLWVLRKDFQGRSHGSAIDANTLFGR